MIEISELTRIQAEALTVLAGLTSTAAIVQALKPHPEDYARVFKPEVAERARTQYELMWSQPPPAFGKPGQTQILVFACEAESLGVENEYSDRFPGGYRKIAHLLVPDRVWVAFKYVEPGKALGMAYDGLVKLGDRWAWFPKPWRHIGEQTPVN